MTIIPKLAEKLATISNKILGMGWGAMSIEAEVRAVKSLIPTGKVFVDVGGNVGHYTNELKNQFEYSEIHVFEPSTKNFQILKNKFEKLPNIHLNNVGLSDKNFGSVLYANESGSGLGSLTKRNLDHFNMSFEHQEEIQLVKFSDYWTKNGKADIIDFMKIDVEGHEMGVLKGVGDLITKIRLIQFEFGGCNIDTRSFFQDFWYFFSKQNFDVYRITPVGLYKIKKYREAYEVFATTNYLCLNKNLGDN